LAVCKSAKSLVSLALELVKVVLSFFKLLFFTANQPVVPPKTIATIVAIIAHTLIIPPILFLLPYY
jgi:hypothetical protein